MTSCERCGSTIFEPGEDCKNCEVLDHRMAGRSQAEKDAVAAKMKADLEEAARDVAAMSDEEKAQLLAEADADHRQLEEEGRLRTNEEILATPPEQLQQESIQRRFALPKDVPPLNKEQVRIVRGLTELTSSDGEPLKGVALAFYSNAWYWGAEKGGEVEWLNEFPWHLMSAINVSGPEAVEGRVTLPRAALFGLFSLGMKKETKRSYLELVADTGTRIFEVKGRNPQELRAELMPVITWVEHYHLSIKAFSEIH
jgi:uncharacterized Zn finger protein (UPF0148 family)